MYTFSSAILCIEDHGCSNTGQILLRLCAGHRMKGWAGLAASAHIYSPYPFPNNKQSEYNS